MKKGWYVVFCKPRCEAIAESNLCNQGYQVYFPRLISRGRRGGKWTLCVEPLFPRYLFVKLRDGAQSLSPVRSTVGVVGLVRFGISPAVVSDGLIEEMRRREDQASWIHTARDIFTEGDRVSFVDGVFSGLEAVYSKRCGEERAIVLLEILGTSTRVGVDAGWLEPAA